MRSVRAILIGAAIALGLASGLVFLGFASGAAAQEIEKPASQDWSFYGPFGTFDRAAAQRGFQVYREVCAACHSLGMVSYRELSALGYNDAEVKAIAASVQIPDTDDQGQPNERPGTPADHFKPPYPNEKATAAALNGAVPPDLSLIAKGRKYGPDYLYALQTGFKDPPAGVQVPKGMYYNEAFPGHFIAMPPPLTDDRVTYADGTKATIAQESHDVITFLSWAADPHLEDRHRIGFRAMFILLAFCGAMYGVKRKIWSNVEH